MTITLSTRKINSISKKIGISFSDVEAFTKNFFKNSCLKLAFENNKKIDLTDTAYCYFIYLLFKEFNITNNKIYDALLNGLPSFIGLGARIGKSFDVINSTNIFIKDGVEIGDNCKLHSYIKIGNDTSKPKLLNNVTIHSNVNIFGNIIIGENVEIKPGCFVTDSIDDNTKVETISQLQLVNRTNKNYLPSQTLIVYGVVPKFKNTILILGDGFYNPIVSFKNSEKQLDYTLSYWDKNKIIIKFKNTKPIKSSNTIITVLSNRTKVTILNSAGLNKALSSLQP